MSEVYDCCDYCGRENVKPQDRLECSKCNRPGCCTEEGGCMPAGRNCTCPECEEDD
jgi:hypothetical protein